MVAGQGSVSKEIALTFLDPVLHVAAGAIDNLVEAARAGPS
jgi:hypothetical protein